MKTLIMMTLLVMGLNCFASEVELPPNQADQIATLGNIITDSQIAYRAMDLERQAEFAPVLKRLVSIYGDMIASQISGDPKSVICASRLEEVANSFNSYKDAYKLLARQDLSQFEKMKARTRLQSSETRYDQAQDNYLACVKSNTY